MKKLALALALSMTLTGANVVATPTDAVNKGLEARIKSLDLSKTEETGALAWVKAHKGLVYSVAGVVAVAGVAGAYDYFKNDSAWSKAAYDKACNTTEFVKGYTWDPAVKGFAWTKDTAADLWVKDGNYYHAPSIVGVTLLALLTFDLTRSSQKSVVKGLVKSMLGGCSKEEAPAAK